MDLSTFIVSVFCLIDDRLKGERIRRRGPAPKLSDSEVITMEVVGEFLVHLQNRWWAMRYSDAHETSYLRPYAFEGGAPRA
jgi:hypothetical protein